MTTSSEADSDTTPGTDLDGGVTADQSPTDDAGVTPGADAGVGTGSLAFTSFLVFLLCLSPFYMLGSNLWGLIDGRGLLLEFTDSAPALDQQLSFKHATMEMLGGYSVSHGILHGMSGGARFLVAWLSSFIFSSSRPAPWLSSGSSPRSARTEQDSSTTSSLGAVTCSGCSWDSS